MKIRNKNQEERKEDEHMSKGRYGIHGGQYISETLMNELIHLEECYEHYKKDPEFNAELNKLPEAFPLSSGSALLLPD